MDMQTTRPGSIVRKVDAAIAKSYLTEPEFQPLRRIVNFYLEFAELQALGRKPITMHAWVTKLDEFLNISYRELLDHAGAILAEVAKAKAEREYERYQALQDAKPRTINAVFEGTVKQLKKTAPARPKRGKKSVTLARNHAPNGGTRRATRYHSLTATRGRQLDPRLFLKVLK